MSAWDKIANCGIALACCAVTADVAYRNLARPTPPTRTPPTAARPQFDYAPGEKLQPIAGLKTVPGKATLLLVVKSTCIYCNQSIDFYRRVVERVRSNSKPLQLVGVCLEPSEACAAYFKKNNVAVNLTIGVPPASLKVSGTPTLLLVDESSNVKSVWLGALPADGEQAVLEALERVTGN